MIGIATIALLAGAPLLAQANSTRVSSDLSLVIDGGAQPAIVPVIAETAQSDLLTYDFATGEIQFSAGVVPPDGGAPLADYDEPLFCFDMGVPQSPVSVQVADPNGHVIIDDFNLKTSLDYILAAPSTLSVNPSSKQQCFFRSDPNQGERVFGLFGMESPDGSVDSGVIHRDRFEVSRSMSLEFQGVPEFVTLGETVNYDLVLTNTGTGDLQHVALQELFPENLAVYAAGFDTTTWTCSTTGGAACPGSSVNANSLRFEQMNAGGVDIPSGGSLTFSIERTVDGNSITGESIRLRAGAVADPNSTGTPFAVDEALMTVIGQSAGLSVSATAAQVTNNATITVTVLDANQNPVPNETVTVDDMAGLDFGGVQSGDSDVNGEVVFTATTESAGDYTVSFTSDGLVGSGSVTFDPGPPFEMVVWVDSDNAIANGTELNKIKTYVEDEWDNPIPALTVDVIESGGLSSLPAFASTNSSGTATFNATSTDATSYSVQIGVSGLGSETVSISFVAGEPDDFSFMTQPSDTPEGGTMSADITLRVVDEFGNWVESDSTTEITLQLRQNNSTTSTLGVQTVTNGETTFSGLDMANAPAGTDYYLRAFGTYNGNPLLESSDTFEITPQ